MQVSKSSWSQVTSGIPQGSVLGPTLFTIFVNDMPRQVESSVKLFADDTKLYSRVPVGREGALQSDIDSLVRWAEKWLLPFNSGKCKVMHLGYHNPGHAYVLNGTLIEATSEEKDLGVIIDDQLKFHGQASVAVSKASQILSVVKRSFCNLDEVTLPLLYKAMVRPFLEYGNVVWGPFNKTDQKRLEKVQRRATRMVSSVKHLPYEDRLCRLKLPSLLYRRRRGDMIAVYQMLHGGMDISPEAFLSRNTSQLTRGHGWKLHKPRAKSFVRRNAFSFRVVNDWNSLPAEVVSADSVNQFKARLDRYWAGFTYLTPF